MTNEFIVEVSNALGIAYPNALDFHCILKID